MTKITLKRQIGDITAESDDGVLTRCSRSDGALDALLRLPITRTKNPESEQTNTTDIP